MKLATGILILGMGLGTAAAQNPSIVDNTKAKLNAVQQQKTADTNAALAASQGQKREPLNPAAAKPAAAKQANAVSQHGNTGSELPSRKRRISRSSNRGQGGYKDNGPEGHGEEDDHGCR